MNYHTLGHFSRAIALLVAAMVGLSYAWHLYTTSSIFIAIGFGTLFTIIIATVWHVLMHQAQTARRWDSRAVIIAIGLIVTIGSIVVSGRALTTLIGGEASLEQEQAETLSLMETALSDAYSNTMGQQDIVSAVNEAAAYSEGHAREECSSGVGPMCRSLTNQGEVFRDKTQELHEDLLAAEPIYEAGGMALSNAREAFGDEKAFDDAISEAQTSIRQLNGIDLAPKVLNSGSVVISDGTRGRVEDITANMHSTVTKLRMEPVEVPVYDPLTAAEAVGLDEDTIGYWFTAAFVESIPFMLLVLLMVFWREPLARSPKDPKMKSDDEIRAREENVIGFSKAAAK